MQTNSITNTPFWQWTTFLPTLPGLPVVIPAGYWLIEVIEQGHLYFAFAPAGTITADVAAALAKDYAAPGMVGGRFLCHWARLRPDGLALGERGEFFLYYHDHRVVTCESQGTSAAAASSLA